jgi:DNA mismatch repair protein MutS2
MTVTVSSIANEKTLRDLEFRRVKEEIGRFAASPLGREAIESLRPTTDLEVISRELSRVEEMRRALEEADLAPGPMEDVEPILKQARETTSLGGEDFLVVLKTLESARRLRQGILDLEGDYPQLHALAERVGVFRELEGSIRRTFDEDGEIREDASPELRALSRRKRTLEARVEARLKELLNSPQYAGVIREPIITRRSSRLVIPIVNTHKRELDCVVHDTSDSGQTLYVEPRAVVEFNNEIREIEGEIRDEKIRILRELTEKLRRESRAIRETLKALKILDGLYARARYAREMQCVPPRLNTQGYVRLRGARHPLLDRQGVVPIDIEFGRRHQGVVITGPNTGGKTVTLKTVGLLALMAQSGIPIPADPESECAVFEVIRSDIGDEQSIEQNLSTFSSHMKNIVGILQDAQERALVLIDELGAGTDPQEGAALGIAILSYLLKTKARLVVTTHFSPLKHFAYQHERLKTYSVAFDVETLRPTYRLMEGVGASNAFAIAGRLGLPPEIIEDAKGALSEGAVQTEEIIRRLQRDRAVLAEERGSLTREREALQIERQRYERALRELEAGVESALRAELKDLQRQLKGTKQQLEEALHRARRGSADEIKAELRRLSAAEGSVREAARRLERPAQRPLRPEELKAGLPVYVTPLGQVGVVREVLDERRVEVEMGGVKVHAKLSDLETAPPESSGSPPGARERRRARQQTAATHELSEESPGLELHVRGMLTSEALREVDLYIDKLVLYDIPRAYIVHGKGTGALKQAIREHLSHDPRVARYYPAPARQGGDGVTVVELS